MNPRWILSMTPNALDVIACDDPAESLARHARHLGAFVLELLGVQVEEDAEGDVPVFHEAMIAMHARQAFRYATAALRLDFAQRVIEGDTWLESAIDAADELGE